MSDRPGPPPPPPVPPPGESLGFVPAAPAPPLTPDAPAATPAPPPSPGKPRTVADVEAYAARALDDLVAVTERANPGQAEGLAIIRERMHNAARPAAVLVAGEAGRGKSALVNALLERPGLSPSGNDLQTAVHISFRFGQRVRARVLTAGGARDVPLQSIAGVVAGQLDAKTPHSSAAAAAEEEEILGAEVELDVPLLREGIELVDTPGVGGLSAAHTRISLAALERADALLFVQDAAAELTAPELDFLAAAALRTRTVAIVLTKSEPYDEVALDKITRIDQAKIAERVPALADVPVVVVSSKLRLFELATGDTGAQLSGFPALLDWLRSEVAARSRTVRLANLLHYLGQVTQTLEALQRVSAAAPTHSARQLAEIEKRLEASMRDSNRWRTRLSDDFADLSRLLRDDISREEMDLRLRYDARIQKWDRLIRDHLGEEVLADLRALAARADTILARGAMQIAENLAVEFETPALTEVAGLAPGSQEYILSAIRGLNARERQKFDPLMLLPTTSTLFIGTRLEQLVTEVVPHLGVTMNAVTWGAVLTPLGLGLGGLSAAALLRLRSRMARRQEAREMAYKAIDRGARELRVHADTRLVQVQRAVRDEIEAAFQRLLADLKQTLGRQREMAAADTRRREQLRKEAQARLLTLQRLRHRLGTLTSVLAEITTVAAVPAPAVGGPAAVPRTEPTAGPDGLRAGDAGPDLGGPR